MNWALPGWWSPTPWPWARSRKPIPPVKRLYWPLQAGADLLLMPAGLAQAYDGVLAAVEDGRLTEERIDESVARILALKQQAGLLQAPDTQQEDKG